MKIKVLTLFPEMFESVLSSSILGRAVEAGHLEIELINIRDYSQNKHKNTDDYPFGGGAGMVMMPQPVVDAIEANSEAGMRRIYMSPRGRTLTQKVVEEYAKCDSLLFLCGHYEGVDQRALDLCIDEELSIGDYVLTGGELGAMVAIDSVARLIPGVLGCDASSEDESFSMGLLEYPQYTRPADYRGMKVPEVLLGGVHKDIEAWRRREALEITRSRRPEMLETAPLTNDDKETLRKMERAEEIIRSLSEKGVQARRMDMFEEAAYAKNWIAVFVPEENRKNARKRCISSKKHVGYLHQAFEAGYLSGIQGEEAITALNTKSGEAVLYYNKENLAFHVDNCAGITLPRLCVLNAPDHSWTALTSGKGELLFYGGLES